MAMEYSARCQACAIGQSLMQYGLHDIYCSAQHDQCSLIIRTFWLHGVVSADLRPDTRCSKCCNSTSVSAMALMRAKCRLQVAGCGLQVAGCVILLVLSACYESIHPAPLQCKRAACANSLLLRLRFVSPSRDIIPAFLCTVLPHQIAQP
jgi:hypothetical protein